MKILIISPEYPSQQNKHAYAFVHARAKIYLANGLSVQVFVPSRTFLHNYYYEGVSIRKGSYELLTEVIQKFNPDVIAIHAPSPSLLIHIQRLQRPIVAWIHGAEVLLRALHHYIPPFGIKNNAYKMLSLVYDVVRNISLRRALSKVNAVVYCSKWMRKISEKYLFAKHPLSFIIPNPVDTRLFKPMLGDSRVKTATGISVRALEWKYGMDVAIRAFSHLKTKLTIIGNGSLEAYLKKISQRVRCKRRIQYRARRA
ncbi:glycosyltransferase [Candidatus Bathyarchaeota archaeon]|nr:glycosyltransferase [Candidatus Bathyarchaeota archaeon]